MTKSDTDSFWRSLGTAAVKGLVEAFANRVGAQLADRLLQKKDKESDAKKEEVGA